MEPTLRGPFEFSGGEACLDFANTWADRGRHETDLLRGYDDLLAFVGEGGLLPAEAVAALAGMAAAQPQRAAEVFATARGLREALYALIAGRARNRALDRSSLDHLNGQLAAAFPRLRLEPAGPRLRWTWTGAGADLAAPLWPVLGSAAALLTSADLDLVRECDGAQCTWLFLDRSRSHSRRWCSMSSCGNRAKARRHYQRRTAP